MERKDMGTCYAQYESETGILRIGNSCIEKVIQQKGCRIRTCSVRDLENGTEWCSEEARYWQRCPKMCIRDRSISAHCLIHMMNRKRSEW